MKDMADETRTTFRSRGMNIPADPVLLPPRLARRMRRGDYERREIEAVRAMVQPDDVVIELGAGLGYMSTFMAANRKVKQVHAFEANPALLPYIARMHEANTVDTVTVHNALLGARRGTAKFYVREDFLASSLIEDPQGTTSPVKAVEEIELRSAKTEFRRIRPSFLVCDIEGAEAEVLARADLRSLRGAVVELHPQWIGKKGVQAVFDAMRKAGLTFYPRTSNKKVAAFLKGW